MARGQTDGNSAKLETLQGTGQERFIQGFEAQPSI